MQSHWLRYFYFTKVLYFQNTKYDKFYTVESPDIHAKGLKLTSFNVNKVQDFNICKCKR